MFPFLFSLDIFFIYFFKSASRTSPIKTVVCQTVAKIGSIFIIEASCMKTNAEVVIKLNLCSKNLSLKVPVRKGFLCVQFLTVPFL